jgi:hypothetical protein
VGSSIKLRRNHETRLVATSVYSATVVVREHHGFVPTIVVNGWSISDKRFNPSNFDAENRATSEPSIAGRLHAHIRVLSVSERPITKPTGRV